MHCSIISPFEPCHWGSAEDLEDVILHREWTFTAVHNENCLCITGNFSLDVFPELLMVWKG